MTDINNNSESSRNEYLSHFDSKRNTGNGNQNTDDFRTSFQKREAALQLALDIRKFEIELYWKRATYFWGFLIVIFGGYFAVLTVKNDEIPYKDESLVLISCLGTIVSWSWYLVNRGSKFWQNNWEIHVDLLEDDFTGPLYKLVFNKEKETMKENLVNFLKPKTYLKAGKYSVSKINQALSLYIFCIFFGMALSNLIKLLPGNLSIGNFDIKYEHSVYFFAGLTLIFCIVILPLCKSDLEGKILADVKITKRHFE